MSEYKIVNRVHPTPAFAQTVAEVEAQAQLDKSLPLVQEVAQNPEVAKVLLHKKGFNVVSHDCTEEDVDNAFKFLEVPKPSAENVGKVLTSQVFSCGEEIVHQMKTAEASRAPLIGKSEPETFNQMVSRMAEELGYADPVVKQSEFKDFKERVIRAFKDMGFDTRKFFDE